MLKISTVAQGGAQRSEQYLEAWTGDGARSAEMARAPEQSEGGLLLTGNKLQASDTKELKLVED